MEKLGVIVLAAGKSERMGAPKPLLRLGGLTLLERILGNPFLSSDFIETVAVTGRYHEELLPYITQRAKIVINDQFEQGRTSSVQCGIRKLSDEATGSFIWPVDCPLITESVLRQVYHEWTGPDSISIPSYGMRRGHPPLIGRIFFSTILSLGADEPLRRLYEMHPESIRYADVDSPWILSNINTPEDYSQLLQDFEKQGSKK